MFQNTRIFRFQVDEGRATTPPMRVGADGTAAFSAYNISIYDFGRPNTDGLYYSVRFRMNLDSEAGRAPNPLSWAGISNVGDGNGGFTNKFGHNVGSVAEGLPPGTWVDAQCYRLDGDERSNMSFTLSTNDNPAKASVPPSWM